MKRRWPSAKTTSNESELLPEPLGPVTTHSFPVRKRARYILQVVLAGVRDGDRIERGRRCGRALRYLLRALAERAPRLRVALRDDRGRSFGDDAPAVGPAARPEEIDHPVRLADEREVVLDHDDRAAVFDKHIERGDDMRGVGGVETGARLVPTKSLLRPPPATARASFKRWASPPESVESGCPSGKYPSPTRASGMSVFSMTSSRCSRGDKSAMASSTVIARTSATDLFWCVTARTSALKRFPRQTGQRSMTSARNCISTVS
ncbi:MAG: hypothetical protein QM702_20725 [Rubrivivax sp.]